MKDDESKEPKMSTEEMAKEDNETPSEEKREGVHLSEEFQQEAHELIHGATKKECSYIRDCLNEREDALRKEESEKRDKGKDGKKKPNARVDFDISDSPSAY